MQRWPQGARVTPHGASMHMQHPAAPTSPPSPRASRLSCTSAGVPGAGLLAEPRGGSGSASPPAAPAALPQPPPAPAAVEPAAGTGMRSAAGPDDGTRLSLSACADDADAGRPLSRLLLVVPSPHGLQALQASDALKEAMRQLQPAHEALCKSAFQICSAVRQRHLWGGPLRPLSTTASDWNTSSSDCSSHSLVKA